MQSFERGRVTGLAGVETVVTLYPDKLGARMKNSVIRMLKNAHVTGGWTSKSKRLTEKLAERFQLCMTKGRYGSLTLYASPEPEVRGELINLIRADLSLFLLEADTHSRKWRIAQAEETISELNSDRATTIYFRDEGMADKAAKLIRENLSEKNRRAIQNVIDMLITNKPIHIATIESNA